MFHLIIGLRSGLCLYFHGYVSSLHKLHNLKRRVFALFHINGKICGIVEKQVFLASFVPVSVLRHETYLYLVTAPPYWTVL